MSDLRMTITKTVGALRKLADELEDVLTRRPMQLHSQRDPRWCDEVYAGGVTFGVAGCYVTAVAMVLSLVGYDDTPPEVAMKLRNVGCFSGALLTHPGKIPDAYPLVCYDGTLRWHDREADVACVRAELEKGPTIVEADFVVSTPEFNQHFFVAEGFTDDGEDLWIVDPWDGLRVQLLWRYARENWDLKRAIYGMRLLRPK